MSKHQVGEFVGWVLILTCLAVALALGALAVGGAVRALQWAVS